MTAPTRRISWIVAPPEVCCLCKEPLGSAEASAWNGSPAHRECVRVHLMQRDPAFHEGAPEEAPEDGEGGEGTIGHDDDGDSG